MAKRILRLNDQARRLVYEVTRKHYLATEGMLGCDIPFVRKQRVKSLVKAELSQPKYESIIATILISLAIKIAIALIVEWLKNKMKNPPLEMPQSFGATDYIEVDA